MHNLVGRRFGKLVVIDRAGSTSDKHVLWLCECDCGKKKTISSHSLLQGTSKSCGCIHKEMLSERKTTHGKSKTRLYYVWLGMLHRCEKENAYSYHNYGGRGIKVCDEWHNFLVFEKWAFENGYDENAKFRNCTIERKDVNGNYEPSNCCWADWKTQCNNKRNSKKGDFNKWQMK